MNMQSLCSYNEHVCSFYVNSFCASNSVLSHHTWVLSSMESHASSGAVGPELQNSSTVSLLTTSVAEPNTGFRARGTE